jgi:hypothetical protein
MKLVSAALALVIFSLAPLSEAGAFPPNTPCGLKRCDGIAPNTISREGNVAYGNAVRAAAAPAAPPVILESALGYLDDNQLSANPAMGSFCERLGGQQCSTW